jgi:WD40 repeat protein
VEAAQLSAKKATDAVPVATTAVAASEDFSKQTDAALEVSKKAATDLEKPLRALAFSPNGQQLASGGEDRLVHTWQAETGAPIESFEGQGEAITAVCFLGDGKLLSGAANKSVIVWDADPAWTLERTIGDANDPTRLIDRVIALDFSPDGKLLATGSGEPSRSGELKFWNVADGNLVRTIPDAHSDTIFCVRFSPDGAFVATSAADRFVKTFNVATGAFYRAFEGHTHHVLGVSWKSDGKTLASCSADNTIKVWDFVTGDQKKTIDGFGKEVTSVNFLADSDRVLSSCGDKTARVNNVTNGGAEKTFNGPGDFIYCSAATPDGKTVVAGGQDSVLRVWNAESGQATFTFDPAAKPAAEAPKK